MRGLLDARLPGMQMGAGWNINTFQGKKKNRSLLNMKNINKANLGNNYKIYSFRVY